MSKTNWKKLLFLDKSWPMRIWMWSAVLCLLYYLIKFELPGNVAMSEWDLYIVAYGMGSLAIYLLIFGFDWSR